ncbi:MAG TPA: APC family permease, partial [Acidobacteriota bacterium]|nr:APC family permease [Acidobacteriota bacterium]
MSAELKRELGFWDLVFFHISAIVGLRWLAVAAATGYSSILVWVLAFLCFFLPQTYVVLHLTRRWPVEGGLYEWTKMALGPFHGFVSGWCYWVNNIVYYPSLLAAAAGFATYLHSGMRGLEENTSFIFWFSLVSLWSILILNMIGMRTGKWVQNIGGITTWIPAGIVIVLGAAYAFTKGPATHFSVASLLPQAGLRTVSFWSYICFALAGFELSSLMGGEIKNPEVNLPKSIPVAGAMATVIYIIGTLALVVSIPQERLSLLSGVLQAIDEQGKVFGFALLASALSIPMVLSQFGGCGAWLAGSGRVLYAIGADRYLPQSLSKVHPRWGTPHISMLVQGVFATLFLIVSSYGAKVKELYLILLDFNVVVYFIPYAYLFIAFVALMKKGRMPLRWTGVAGALLGLASTLVSIVLSLLPAEDKGNVWLYEAKLIGGCLIMVGSGLVFYFRGGKKTQTIN